MSEIHKILSDIWGYNSFRAGQEEIINHLLNKKSVLAITSSFFSEESV